MKELQWKKHSKIINQGHQCGNSKEMRSSGFDIFLYISSILAHPRANREVKDLALCFLQKCCCHRRVRGSCSLIGAIVLATIIHPAPISCR